MAEQYGHVKISRKAFDTDRLWLERREFSKWEAWVDCIQMAAWKPYTRLVGATVVELGRGEFLASVRYLAHRWCWSEKKVWTFLTKTISDRVAVASESKKGNVYRIVNYDAYQSNGNAKETVRKQQGNKEEADKAYKANTSPTDLLFEAIWLEYPRKVNKQTALKAWNKIIVRGDPKAVEAGIFRYVAYVKANNTEPRFVKHLATLLNSGEWQDDWTIEGVVPFRKGEPVQKDWWVDEVVI